MDGSTVVLLICGFALLLVIGAVSEARKKRKRREGLLAKYGDPSIVDDIIGGLIRQGMSTEMVLDTWGKPAAVDTKVYRTKVKEVLKYNPGPRRSFANRVTLEDGVVVGWENR
jgi:hypothetical protein